MNEQKSIVQEEYYSPWDRWFENRIYPSKDGISIFFQEITERKRAEAQIKRHQHFIEQILEAEPGTVHIYDLTERRNIYVNKNWLTEFGYTKEETLEMGNELLARVFHPDDTRKIVEHHESWRFAGDGEIREFEYRARTKDGDWRWMSSREVPFARDGSVQVSQILGIAQDVTERKYAGAALHASEERFSKAFNLSPVRMGILRLKDATIIDINDRLGLEGCRYKKDLYCR